MILRENKLLFFVAFIIFIILVLASPELFVATIFGLSILIFLAEKILLADSLKFTRLTLPSFFMLLYIILMCLPSMAAFFKMEHPIKYTYFIAIQSVLITFPIGGWLANLFAHHPSRIITNFLYSNLEKTRDDFKSEIILSLHFSVGSISSCAKNTSNPIFSNSLFKSPANSASLTE